jgi:filamentous hemagglutinin
LDFLKGAKAGLKHTDEIKFLRVADAKQLPGPHQGVILVLENLGDTSTKSVERQIAADFEAGTSGAFSDVVTRNRVVPALRFDNTNPAGHNFVKFDGFEGNTLLIDAKTRLLTFESQGRVIIPQAEDLRRMNEALRQNPEFRGVIEFPDEAARAQAEEILNGLGLNNIETRVRR